MALSLDDRLLGEKVHNYCSSSEGENSDSDVSDIEEGEQTKQEGTFLYILFRFL